MWWRSRVVEKIRAIRGMNDILPHETGAWRLLEQTFINCLTSYAYQEIRFPFLENTSLFKRTIGEVTDIVEKEMYTFQDLNGDSITLRPEGTAGCLRACLEHGLLYNQQQKLWYIGPMFRYERPQKGRYRQFNQLGVEALGIAGVGIELELIAICNRLWQELGLDKAVCLQINTLGELSERQTYKEQLVSFFNKHYNELDEDSQRRLTKNPLRILDSKNPDMQALLREAPKLIDSLGKDSKGHFLSLCAGLDKMGINYEINPLLVRGLDYYGHTVFEWVTDKLGSQATVCAGGRYDSLINQLGGNATPAVGFAMGAERLLLLMETLDVSLASKSPLSLFLIATDHDGLQQALIVAEQLHNYNKTWQIITNTSGGSFKSQFKKADKAGADIALILGDDEVNNNQISIKNLRNNDQQVTISQNELINYLQNYTF